MNRPKARLSLRFASGLALGLSVVTRIGAQTASTPASASSTVVLRGGESAPAYSVVSISDAGVTVRTATLPPRMLSWDRVERIEGALATEAESYRDLAETCWRARIRLERGDAPAAEALYEDLMKTYAATNGPTAASIAEGLLRCRMRRGAQAAAVVAYLAWLEAATPLQDYVQSLNSRDVAESHIFVDPATGLLPALAPVWLNTPATQAFARGDLVPQGNRAKRAPISQGSPSAQLALLYRRAAQFEAGQAMEAVEESLKNTSHPGLSLVVQMVMARTGDPGERAAARASLRSMLNPSTASWSEPWIHVALGRSLLREASSDEQLLGVAEMLQLPSRMSQSNPYLTGVALAEAAVASLRHNDTGGAIRLRKMLIERFPDHPALDWEPIRGWAVQALPEPPAGDASKIESIATPSGEETAERPARK